MIVRIVALARLGVLQLLRSRVYLNLVVAGVALLGAALLIDRLSGGESARVFINVGLAFISLVVAVLVGVVGITLVTREIETKQIHGLIARPLSRSEIVFGRFFTLAALVVLSNLLLGTLLAVTQVLIGEEGALRALAAALFGSFEGFMVAGLALFFGVGSSSTVSALFVVTGFLLGRMSPALYELIAQDRFGSELTPVLEAVYIVLPHLDRFDLSLFARTGTAPGAGALLGSVLYCGLYTTALLLLAGYRLEKRELL